MTGDTKASSDRGFMDWVRQMPRWKKIAVGVAITAVVVSGVLHMTATGSAPAPASQPKGLATSLIDGRQTTGGTTAEEPASQGVFRLGFSFLAGFCIGSFLRATLKLAAIAFGFWLLMTFVLNYLGIVVVDWQAMDSLWNRFASNVEQEWGSFQRFMTGSLPAAGLAAAGLAIGLKRH